MEVMREHQIVINLKREQFEEVQRLARLAGSKSVTTYLRDKVLTLIGLEEGEPHATQMFSPSAQEMHGINQELARMHRELQVFIAESLSNSANAGDEELEFDADSELSDHVYNAFQEMERNMHQEIARLQALPEGTASSTMPPSQSAPQQTQPPPPPPARPAPASKFESDTDDDPEPPPPFGRPAPPPLPASPVSIPDAIEPGTWSDYPVSNYVESAGIYSNTAAESIWLTPPVPATQPTNQASTAGGGTPGDYGQPNDDLEDLAERAFAISPRLGTVDNTPPGPAGFRKRQVEDPLSDLIDDTIMQQAEMQRLSTIEESTAYDDGGVVYAFGGPDTETTQPEPEMLAPETLDQPDDAMVVAADTGLTESADQVETEMPAPVVYQQETAPSPDQTAADEEQTQSPPASHVPAPDPTSLGGPPPKRRRPPENDSEDDSDRFSGGPPPKRRKK